MTKEEEDQVGRQLMARIRRRRRRPFVRVLIAHVLACYLWVGQIAVVSLVFGDRTAATQVEEEEDDGSLWFLSPWCWVPTAPITVPVVLGGALFFTVASPVERVHPVFFLTGLAMYLGPCVGTWFWLRHRDRKNNPSLSGFPVTLKKPIGFD